VIAFVHTLLANQELTKVTRVMIFTPVNALLNWRSEFDKWLVDCDYVPDVYDISDGRLINDRLKILREWFNHGGVFIIGYTMFTTLLAGKSIKSKKQREEIAKYLTTGADLVVCDEGHVLKNEKTAISKQLNRIQTLKRIILTGMIDEPRVSFF
jgi:transcriptional regulator ATRX